MSSTLAMVLCSICFVAALAWVPILLKFFRTWRARKNPVSFAIITVIALCMYCSLTGIWFFTGQASPMMAITAIVIGELVVCVNFHVAFAISDARFPSARHPQK